MIQPRMAGATCSSWYDNNAGLLGRLTPGPAPWGCRAYGCCPESSGDGFVSSAARAVWWPTADANGRDPTSNYGGAARLARRCRRTVITVIKINADCLLPNRENIRSSMKMVAFRGPPHFDPTLVLSALMMEGESNTVFYCSYDLYEYPGACAYCDKPASCTSCAAGNLSTEGATDCSKCERGKRSPLALASASPVRRRFAKRRAGASASLPTPGLSWQIGSFRTETLSSGHLLPGRRRGGVHPMRGRAVRL